MANKPMKSLRKPHQQLKENLRENLHHHHLFLLPQKEERKKRKCYLMRWRQTCGKNLIFCVLLISSGSLSSLILFLILILFPVKRWDMLVKNILEVTDRNCFNLWKNVCVGAGEVTPMRAVKKKAVLFLDNETQTRNKIANHEITPILSHLSSHSLLSSQNRNLFHFLHAVVRMSLYLLSFFLCSSFISHILKNLLLISSSAERQSIQ